MTRAAQSQSPDRWLALVAEGAYLLTYLQAVEAESLPNDWAVVVSINDERDDMGLPRVDLLCADRDALIAYVREHWGDDDRDWFRDYVVGRIERVGGGS